jgi:hypothetical protein
VVTAAVEDDSWDKVRAELGAFSAALTRSKAVNVNTQSLRDSGKQLVQHYFREARPGLNVVGFSDDELQTLDAEMQTLLRLAQGRNAKRSYATTLRRIRELSVTIESQREFRIGEQRKGTGDGNGVSSIERRIIETLRGLVPSAALSYEQALSDLRAPRLSYRGTAAELRETLRETLDHLAPDHAVMAVDGFSLEKGRAKPTQKQKVRHILRSRQVSRTARSAPESAVDLIEELTGSLARASYDRSSLATHVASTEGELRQMKMYVDSVLAELLEIHA